jgi:uncharacterized protein (DUF952 family)
MGSRECAKNAMSDIFKILRTAEWHAFQHAGLFAGSLDDLRDGFIHFSAAEQVSGTLEKYFSNEAEVVILRVAAAPLGDALKWEASRDGALFPHLYRPLALSEAGEAQVVRKGHGGYDPSALGL